MFTPLTPLKGVKCTYPQCYNSFNTQQDMKRHKISSAEHDYCKKCDYDAVDWDDLLQHKVTMMEPFLRKENQGCKSKPPHIVCEFCGVDFKSVGGREMHRRQAHQKEQQIVCPGCESIFTRASGLITHLERGSCTKISRREFESERQHKHILSQIMKAPDVFSSNLNRNTQYKSHADRPGSIRQGSDGDDQQSGGVTILDEDVHDQRIRALQPEVDLIDLSYVPPRYQEYPKLSSQGSIVEGMARLTMGSGRTSASSRDDSNSNGSEYGDTRTASPAGAATEDDSSFTNGTHDPSPTDAATENDSSSASENKSDAWTIPSNASTILFPNARTTTLTPRWELIQSQREKQQASYSKTNLPAGATTEDDSSSARESKSNAWTTHSNASTVLFPNARTTPLTPRWELIQSQRERQQASHSKTNLFHARFWDPTSADYDPERFLDPVIKVYRCPFPDCGTTHPSPPDIAFHLQHHHALQRPQCPSCMRIFGSTAALVAHAESASARCRIRRADCFAKAIEGISGGFLDARRVRVPVLGVREGEEEDGDAMEGVVVGRQGIGRAKKVMSGRLAGVTDVEFSGKMPDGFW
ncbi:hypothetical protein LTR28_004959 [Elasticomyces elasticus]|nr:hypothetical protein LTR28_004959 [Elasticomyces elasticus]